MQVRCDLKVFEKFPDASIHAIVVDQVGQFSEQDSVAWKLRALESVRESQILPERLVETPAIQEWRNTFQRFGLKPSKYHSSIEQLYRRALKGDIIETPLPLVNLYCYVSIIQLTPMGGYDLQKTQGDILIRHAKAEEEFTPLGNDKTIKSPPGVVVYTDSAGIICWGWNHRDSSRTSLDAGTQKAIFFADSATQNSRGRAAHAITLLSEALSSIGCLNLTFLTLDQQKSEASF